jgi:hypothetical protein
MKLKNIVYQKLLISVAFAVLGIGDFMYASGLPKEIWVFNRLGIYYDVLAQVHHWQLELTTLSTQYSHP